MGRDNKPTLEYEDVEDYLDEILEALGIMVIKPAKKDLVRKIIKEIWDDAQSE